MRRTAVGVLAPVALALATGSTALASQARVDRLLPVSDGMSPFQEAFKDEKGVCSNPYGDPSSSVRVGAEVDPAIAVDPADPDRIVTAYEQDRRLNGGAQAIAASWSSDAGKTFTRVLPPNISACTATADDSEAAREAKARYRAHLTSITADSRGTFYLATRSFDKREVSNVYPQRMRVTVSTSRDGGRSWSDPARLAPRPAECKTPRAQTPWMRSECHDHDGRPIVAAHPSESGTAFVGWVEQAKNYVPCDDRLPNEQDYCIPGSGNSGIWLAKTTDSGRTWSEHYAGVAGLFERDGIEEGSARLSEFDVVTGVLPQPDGSILMTITGMPIQHGVLPNGQRGRFVHYYVRSKDGGKTWSEPKLLGTTSAWKAREVNRSAGAVSPLVEDNDGRDVRSFQLSSAMAAPDGTSYISWADNESTYSSRIFVRRYDPQAQQWGPKQTAASLPAQSFLAQAAVLGDGTVGVSWYDFSDGDEPGDGEMTTRAWLAHSHDDGQTWERSDMTPRFDIGNAVNLPGDPQSSPLDPGLFVGDYTGLTPLPHGFAAALPIPNSRPNGSIPPRGESDVWFARVRLKGHSR